MAYDRNDRRGGRKGRRKVCSFCVDKVETIDYKDVPRLRKFISDRSKIPVSYTHLTLPTKA